MFLHPRDVFGFRYVDKVVLKSNNKESWEGFCLVRVWRPLCLSCYLNLDRYYVLCVDFADKCIYRCTYGQRTVSRFLDVYRYCLSCSYTLQHPANLKNVFQHTDTTFPSPIMMVINFMVFIFIQSARLTFCPACGLLELDDDKKLHSLARDVSGRMSIWGGQHRQARKNFMNLHYLCIRLNLEYHKNEQSLPCSFYKSNVVNLLKIPHQGLTSKGFVSSYVAFSARNKNMISYFTLWLPYFMLWGNVKSVRKLMLRYHNGNERMKMVSGVYLVSVMLNNSKAQIYLGDKQANGPS